MTDEKAIEIRGLEKTYLDFWHRPTVHALRGLDLSVARGEIFGLLGPNGSGKSTAIKLLLGLIAPTAGSVAIFGRPPSDIAVRNRIGYLPEVTNLHRFLTPAETLRYYAGLFGLDRETTRRRTEELLAMVGLEKAANREIGQFSKGMARRVGIAQALVNNPALIVLDEPTSGLDPQATRQVKDLMLSLARSGTTILTTSHLLADVQDTCSRVAILHRGHLLAEGPLDTLLQRPAETTLTFPTPPDPATADRLLAATAAALRLPPDALRLSHPRKSLEEYFLDIIAKDTAP